MRWLGIGALAVFAVDQLSKLIVVHWMDLVYLRNIYVLPPYLNFKMGWNTGVNFGLFANNAEAARYLLIGVSVVVSFWLANWARKSFRTPLQFASAGAVIGGALANAFDRVLYGAVADFLNMSCCGYTNPYSFNLADVGIFVGVIGLLFLVRDEKTP